MGVMNPGLVMRNVIPVVMAGILGIYGLIVAVIITGNSKASLPPSLPALPPSLPSFLFATASRSFPHLLAI